MRDRYGKLQGDLTRFPSGIKWLADQIHSRGLLLGLYGCAGVRTCLGFPGQFEHEYTDAATVAEWGIDFWKHDNCFQRWSTVDTYATPTIVAVLLKSLLLYLHPTGITAEEDGRRRRRKGGTSPC